MSLRELYMSCHVTERIKLIVQGLKGMVKVVD